MQLVISCRQVHESQNSESEKLRPECHPPTRHLKNKFIQSGKTKKNKTKKSCWCFRVCIKPSEVGGIMEVQCVSSCIWLTSVAVAFTCRLMFEHFQTHSECTMSQYQGDIFHVWFSFGPWLDPSRGLVCLNLSGVNGHARLWCQLCLRKKQRHKPSLLSDHQKFTWHSRWNVSQICWNYFAYPSKVRANGKQLQKWDHNQMFFFFGWMN